MCYDVPRTQSREPVLGIIVTVGHYIIPMDLLLSPFQGKLLGRALEGLHDADLKFLSCFVLGLCA
jgi:hypothetical protein